MKTILKFINDYSNFGWLLFAIMYYLNGNNDMAITMFALFVIDSDFGKK